MQARWNTLEYLNSSILKKYIEKTLYYIRWGQPWLTYEICNMGYGIVIESYWNKLASFIYNEKNILKVNNEKNILKVGLNFYQVKIFV